MKKRIFSLFASRRIGKVLTVGAAAWALLAACQPTPASIRVKLPKDSLQSNKAQPELAPFTKRGDTIRLRASAYDKKQIFMGPADVEWSVEDPVMASVAPDGLVTILASGETKVVARTKGDGPRLEDAMTIRAVIVDKVKIVHPPDLRVHLGETIKLEAEVLDDRGRTIPNAKVEWRTSDYAATVTPWGEVEGRAIGDTQVIAEAGGRTDRVEMIVLDWRRGQAKR